MSSGNVRKVYISDSPVIDDNLEYNYVNSDIEEDLGEEFPRNAKLKQRQATPGPPPLQSQSSEALTGSNLTVDTTKMQPQTGSDDAEPTEDLTNDEDELEKEAEYQRQLQDRLQNARIADTTNDNRDNIEPNAASNAAKPQFETSDENSGSDAKRVDAIMQWENPPPNPFVSTTPATQSQPQPIRQEPNRYEDMIKTEPEEEQFVPQNYKTLVQSEPHLRKIQQNPQPQPPQPPVPSRIVPQQQQQQQLQHQQNLALSSTSNAPSQFFGGTSLNYTYPSPVNPQYYNNEFRQSYQNPPNMNIQQFQLNDYGNQPYNASPVIYHNPNAQPYDGFSQVYQQPQPTALTIPTDIGLQRNQPVLYQVGTAISEYHVPTPREMRHPYVEAPPQNFSPQERYRYDEENFEIAESEVASENSFTPGNNAVKLPPKPTKPQRDFLAKNKRRAHGQASAKPGYSERLLQKRIEQEQLKEWAPGMVLPRKKAASADDIIRNGNDGGSPEDVWHKRSRELAHAKMKNSGNGRKPAKKPASLKRYPSDNSLPKANSKIPPINPKGGYVAQFQQQQATNNQWVQEPPNRAFQQPQGYTSPQYNERLQYGPLNTYQNNATGYNHQQTNFPVESPAQVQPQTYYQPPQPQIYQASPGPPPISGGYHHHARQSDPRFQQTQPPNNEYNGPVNQPPAQTYQPETSHPTYDYSGYQKEQPQFEKQTYAYSSPSVDSYFHAKNSRPTAADLNPYSAVPPIHKEDPGAGGSYIKAYQDQKEKAERAKLPPQYKVYTMSDYKKLKLEYKLGGLGNSQDPEEIREKNEKRLKQLQYAKEVMEVEKQKPANPSPRKENSQMIQEINSRRLMVEYAKNVPKPKVQHYQAPVHKSNKPEQSPSPAYNSSDNRQGGTIPALKPVSPIKGSPSQPGLQRIAEQELEELTVRHDEEQRLVNDIQSKMQHPAYVDYGSAS